MLQKRAAEMDFDLDRVAMKIFMGAFYNTAQICVATKRLYIHEDIYDALRQRRRRWGHWR